MLARLLLAAGVLLLAFSPGARSDVAASIGEAPYVAFVPGAGGFPLVQGTSPATLIVDESDWPGVIRAAGDLRDDITRVTGLSPKLVKIPAGLSGPTVIIGTVGHSPLIDGLIRSKKIDASPIAGKWESFFLQTVSDPMPGVGRALVIAGSDKRGTIYGVYDLSEQIGVSPWYWWADVTPTHRTALFVRPGTYQQGEPSVKYRGIFFNDEKPDLTGWARAKFGEHPDPANPSATVANLNSKFYARVFEVILRLKGNYLWPAMWNNAFAEDDPDNPRLADEYGIVMGTSHQEPMLRAQKEWDWHLRPQFGNWNYATQPQALETFWREGIRQRKGFESIYTIGLRGENDTAMAQGTEQNILLLDRIVASQRKMIAEDVNADVTKVPQLWCLYKEVQGYYERGLRVPDDVTLLWAEDNWGNVRRLPTEEERKRPGGAGVYYHFDYHGGPRSYQWINTSPIAKIWDQMSLAKAYGADRVWIVNVGHFKGYEFPTEYFLKLAWNTSRWTNDNIAEYTRLWAAREFSPALAEDIADVISTYTKFNGRRKPELIDAATYSLVNYQEAERIVSDYNALVAKAEVIFGKLPRDKQDAFYELALFPVKASAQVNEMYVAAAKNVLFAAQGRASTNDMSDRTRALFQADRDLTADWNKIAGGKWEHFNDQPHIGYTTWADPPIDNMNAIKLVSRTMPEAAGLGVSVEGSASAWPGATDTPALSFDSFNRQRRAVDVFNRGRAPYTFTATPSAPWITLSTTRGPVEKDTRVWMAVDWSKAPTGSSTGSVNITGAGESVTIAVDAFSPSEVTRSTLRGFVEGDGYVSMEAEHYASKTDAGATRWIRIEDFGHTLSGMRAESPVTAAPATGPLPATLEYRLYLFTTGPVTASLTLAPTLNFVPGRGLRLAVSFDGEAPKVIDILPANYNPQNGNADWEKSVRNARIVTSSHTLATPGYHTLKLWMVDPAVVVQKIVVNTAKSKNGPSYLGPPESFQVGAYGARLGK